MTKKNISAALFLGVIPFLWLSCEHTYKRETMRESIRDLAQKEYELQVEVQETVNTMGVRYYVKNLLGELVAADQKVWNEMEDLMMVLSRVSLSSNDAPDFFVLDVADEDDPQIRFVFTRYGKDVKKLMSGVISRSRYLDRLLIEFVVGQERTPFDPLQTDLVRLMMMAMDVSVPESFGRKEYNLEDIRLSDFLAKVAANQMRRLLREHKFLKDDYILREVKGSYREDEALEGRFKIWLDLVLRPQAGLNLNLIQSKILPFVAQEASELLKSYKFSSFSDITVIEKNSGAMLTVLRK